VNLDGRADLVVLTPSIGNNVSVLVGQGNGGFFDATIAAFANPGVFPAFADLAVIGARDNQVIVAATAAGRVFRWSRRAGGLTPWFGNAEEVPLHGSGAFTDLVTGDVDGDDDADLVVLRTGTAPQVLLNRDSQLSSLAVGQAGRTLALQFDGHPGDAFALFLGFVPFRFDVPPFGVLRMADPLILVTVPIGNEGTVSLPLGLPATMPRFDLMLQVARLRSNGTILFGNLLRTSVTPH
jgi:hypothetical protein